MNKINSRGQVETQFNWIFILIAGGIILMAAFTFVMRQRSAAEMEMAATLARQIDEITTSAGIARGTAQVIDLPRIETYLICTEECSCSIEIDPAASKGFEDKIIFGPEEIDGDMLIWAQEWNAPFRVANFIYITSPANRYIIVREKGNALGEYIEEKLPSSMNVIFTESHEDVKHQGEEYTRIIFVDMETGCDEIDESFKSEAVDCVTLRADGDYTFWEKAASRSLVFEENAVHGVGKAALFGAIFSEDDTMFKCNMYTAVRRLSYVAKIYSDKMKVLEKANNEGYTEEEGYPICPISYNNILGTDIEAALDELSETADDAFGNMNKFVQLEAIMTQIETANEELIYESCPEVY